MFLEIPLDVQGATVEECALPPITPPALPKADDALFARVAQLYSQGGTSDPAGWRRRKL